MSPDDEAADLLQRYWAKGRDEDTAYALRSLACSTPPQRLPIAARCLTVVDTLRNSQPWEVRIQEYREHVARLRQRVAQLDLLGDTNTDPQAVVEVLTADLIDGFDASSLDVDALRRSRLGKGSRALAAFSFLAQLGWENLTPAAAEALQVACNEGIKRASLFNAVGLVEEGGSIGLDLGVSVSAGAAGIIGGYSTADREMTTQINAVLNEYLGGVGASWSLEYEAPFGGASVGLAIWLATEASMGRRNPDPWLAATGRILPGGRIQAVAGIIAKVTAALTAGYRRILVPLDNLAAADEALAAFYAKHPHEEKAAIHAVATIGDVTTALEKVAGRLLGVDGAARIIRDALPARGMALVDETAPDNCHRLTVTDGRDEASIDIFRGRRATIKVNGGKTSTTAQLLGDLRDQLLPQTPIVPRSNVTALVPADRLQSLKEDLHRCGAVEIPTTSDYEAYRYQLTEGGSKASITGYTSKKAVVQGTAPAHDTIVTALADALNGLAGAPVPPTPGEAVSLTGSLAQSPSPAVPPSLAERPFVPHIGTDEAGKGDYFGPLVCAAVYVNDDDKRFLEEIGVKDSKKIADKRLLILAKQIRQHMGGRFAVTTLPPSRYNSLTQEMKAEGKGLNSVVAWGHVRSIRNLLEHPIAVDHVLIDKFADERLILDRIPPSYAHLKLEHQVRAEADIAVAAASILAREAFLNWLEKEAHDLGLPLPKGAGPQVIVAAKNLVAAHGEPILDRYAKVSFKTTKSVLDS